MTTKECREQRIQENAQWKGNKKKYIEIINTREHEEQRKKKYKQQRAYRQRKQYSTNSSIVQEVKKNPMKKICLKYIYAQA